MNSRSSVSRLASSAPSQRIAGPSRVSKARSGPTANGISTTTVRKNSTPISAPPPTRSAIAMSLRISAASEVILHASASRAWNDDLMANSMRSLPPQGGRERRGRCRAAYDPALSLRAPDPQFAHRNPERRVGGGDDQAAAGEMISHQRAEHGLPGGIERA